MPHKDPEAKKAYMRERYQRKAEELKQYQRGYRAANKDKIYEARKDYLANWHRANGDRRRRKTNQDRLIAKAKLVLHHGGECVICGFSDHLAALEFHHRDPATKSFMLNNAIVATKTWEELLVESEKCDLLCANCHAQLHALYDEEMIGVAMSLAAIQISKKYFGEDPTYCPDPKGDEDVPEVPVVQPKSARSARSKPLPVEQVG